MGKRFAGEGDLGKGKHAFTLTVGDLDALGIRTLADLKGYEWDERWHFTSESAGEGVLVGFNGAGLRVSGAGYVTDEREDSELAALVSAEVTDTTAVRAARYSGDPAGLPFGLINLAVNVVFRELEDDLRKRGIAWDDQPMFRRLCSGDELIRYVKNKQLDPPAVLEDLVQAERSYLADVDTVARAVGREAEAPNDVRTRCRLLRRLVSVYFRAMKCALHWAWPAPTAEPPRADAPADSSEGPGSSIGPTLDAVDIVILEELDRECITGENLATRLQETDTPRDERTLRRHLKKLMKAGKVANAGRGYFRPDRPPVPRDGAGSGVPKMSS